MVLPVALVTGAALLVLLLVGLTSVGERRRGGPWPLVVAAGLVFPLTWAIWYARDQLPVAHTVPRRPGTQRLPHQRESSSP